MSFNVTGLHLLANNADNQVLVNVINLMIKELNRMQTEIDELKKGKK